MKADTEKCSLNICWFIIFFVQIQFYLKILHSLTAVSESVSGTGSRACSTLEFYLDFLLEIFCF